jgi:hypothetical protein
VPDDRLCLEQVFANIDKVLGAVLGLLLLVLEVGVYFFLDSRESIVTVLSIAGAGVRG